MEAALYALLASIAGGRRFWGRKPETEPARPYVVMQIISDQRDTVYSGPTGYVQTRVQIDVYADYYTTARDTANAIVTLLSGYHGGLIQGVFIDSQRDLPAAAPGETSTLFRRSIDIMIHHQEN